MDAFLNKHVESEKVIGRLEPKNVEENIRKWIIKSDKNMEAETDSIWMNLRMVEVRLRSGWLSHL